MIKIKEYPIPQLKLQKFTVDTELHPVLTERGGIHELINKSNFILLLGRAGSGKTSLATGLLGTSIKRGGLKHIFDQIFVFIPPSSRSSMKDNFFEKYLPEDQIYDDLTIDNLDDAYSHAKENAKEEKRTLFILDDVQKNLRGECEKLFLSIVNNRRHARLNLMILCQNYFSMSKPVRSGLTDLFIFKVSKQEMEAVFEEQVETHKNKFIQIVKFCFQKPYDFLYINTGSQRIFKNWFELLISNETI